jgi:hypothetical protein
MRRLEVAAIESGWNAQQRPSRSNAATDDLQLVDAASMGFRMRPVVWSDAISEQTLSDRRNFRIEDRIGYKPSE